MNASQQQVIDRTAAHLRSLSLGESSGHDWWHTYRVWQMARKIAAVEGADGFVVEVAALLHDIADWKFSGGDDAAGPAAARHWLAGLSVKESITDHVAQIIADLSFKGAQVATPMATLEGQVVQDADRLDALGAIGIARTFAYGGFRGRPIYDPEIPPHFHDSFESYKKSTGPSINHFYEKLLLLKDRMNTATARQLAQERHAVMEQFLEQFFREWGVPEH